MPVWVYLEDTSGFREEIFIFSFSQTPQAAAVLAGLLAAAVCYHLNGRALKAFGEEAVTYAAPVFEELLKTGFALALGGGVFLSHLTFGAVEAAYDLYKNRGAPACRAGIAGFVSHGVFGAVTGYCIKYFNNPLPGLIVSILIHMGWNYTVMNFNKLF